MGRVSLAGSLGTELGSPSSAPRTRFCYESLSVHSWGPMARSTAPPLPDAHTWAHSEVAWAVQVTGWGTQAGPETEGP